MAIQIIQIPYDSGHRGQRMGRGPLHLVEAGLIERLREPVTIVPVQLTASTDFPTEIGSAFELHRALAASVTLASKSGDLPLILSGNCNASLGTVAGLQSAGLLSGLGVIWFDGHGDSDTPDTFTGDFLDAMGLSTLTGRCWQALCATVPGFRPLSDETVLLIGGHAADDGAIGVLKASGIGWQHSETLRTASLAKSLAPTLSRMAQAGVTRVYLHLDVDVLDARYAAANEFARAGGLFPEHVAECLQLILERFDIAAAGVASYDPSLDKEGLVGEFATSFLEAVAQAHRAVRTNAKSSNAVATRATRTE
jgi:arginase